MNFGTFPLCCPPPKIPNFLYMGVFDDDHESELGFLIP